MVFSGFIVRHASLQHWTRVVIPIALSLAEQQCHGFVFQETKTDDQY